MANDKKEDDVTQTRKEYDDALPGVELNRLAVAGQRAVKEAGVKCLEPLASMKCCTVYDGDTPKTVYSGSLSAEGQAKYDKYLSNAYFYGATGRTVTGLCGLISSKKPTKELTTSTQYLEENINGKGQTLRDFADEAVSEAFVTPWSGVLVAAPETPEGASKLDKEVNNLKAKILHYKFESIINWDFETINNEEKLSLLVLKESVTERQGFNVSSVLQYRVLELREGVYHQAVYNDKGEVKEDYRKVLFNGKEQTEIPFYLIIPEAMDKSAIDDLVDANFQHYNIYADYGSKLHYSSFIIYTENGNEHENNNMAIGNGVKWNGPMDGSFGILQPDGNADSHRIALQDTQQLLASLGAEMLKPRVSGAESAEAKSLDQVAQNATTANVAITVSDAIVKAIRKCDEIEGGSGEGEFSLNTDYNPTGMSSQDLRELFLTWQGNGISYETFYENLQRGEIASTERSAEDEKALIGNQDTGMNE